MSHKVAELTDVVVNIERKAYCSTWQSLDSHTKVQTFVSQNDACLVGELFPRPVGVFFTHLEPPNGHFQKTTKLRFWGFGGFADSL